MELFQYIEEIGRVAAAPLIGYPGLRLKGIKAETCFRNPKQHAEIVKFVTERFELDIALPLLDLTVEAEALGAESKFGEYDSPLIEKHLSPESIDLSIEVNPTKTGRLPLMIETARIMAQEIKNVPIGFYVTGPLTLASQTIGAQRLMKDMVKQEPYVHELIELATRLCIDYSLALEEAGVDFLVVAEPLSSLISPTHFREYSKPYLIEMAGETNKDIVLHICGRANKILEDMVNIGMRGISIDQNISLEEAAEVTPEEVLIFGNYPPLNLAFKKPQEIKKEVDEMLKPVAGLGNIVACTGCDVPSFVPPQNIEAFVDGVKSFTP